MSKQLIASTACLMFCLIVICSARAADVPAPEEHKISTPIEHFMDRLVLNAFKAALADDIALCKDDQNCIEWFNRLKFLDCAGHVCEGSDKAVTAEQCSAFIPEENIKSQWPTISSKMCELVASPLNPELRKTLMNLFPGSEEVDVIRSVAFIIAAGGSAKGCEDLISEYLGPKENAWNPEWYRVAAGCRMLAHESTPDQEEQDFYTWFGVYRHFSCSAILNPELNNACQSITSAPPSPYATDSREKEPLSIQTIVDRIGLNAYEAAKGDLSLCQYDQDCWQRAKRIKAALCIAKVCPGNATDKKPAECIGDSFGGLTEDVKGQINKSFCPMIKEMDDSSLAQFKKYFPKADEKDFIEFESYVLAVSESSASCQNHIKHFVDPHYGPQWNYQWYRAMSGCRLITGESTRTLEESDFYNWIGARRNFDCSDIVDKRMGKACPTQDIAQYFISK